MGKDGDLALAEKVVAAGVKMVREHIAEMRRQGRIKVKLYLTIREGRRRIEVPYRED